MGWIFLAIAGVCEIGFTTALKFADGFTRLVPSLVFAVLYLASAWFLSQAVKTIPLGTAYAVWTGIGAIGTAIIGIALFGDPATAARLFFLALIVAGIVGLKLVSN
ncbi:MAG: multidrug efflux SMR transporter [Rhodospirillaceae bacterium]|nr:multidrug efflux SMR transporter [Rhodospirillaceae bacterium]